MTARSARPISRWISTVRPFWRPALASRSVRSPVDAGSSEYSAVIQPRPLPLSQRGTPSWIDAVQRTSVCPCAQSTEPVRLLEEVGLELERAQLVGPPPVGAGSRGGRLELGDRHVLDLVDRQLEEALRPVARKSSVSPVVRKR